MCSTWQYVHTRVCVRAVFGRLGVAWHHSQRVLALSMSVLLLSLSHHVCTRDAERTTLSPSFIMRNALRCYSLAFENFQPLRNVGPADWARSYHGCARSAEVFMPARHQDHRFLRLQAYGTSALLWTKLMRNNGFLGFVHSFFEQQVKKMFVATVLASPNLFRAFVRATCGLNLSEKCA